jgi:hypothetical protein
LQSLMLILAALADWISNTEKSKPQFLSDMGIM